MLFSLLVSLSFILAYSIVVFHLCLYLFCLSIKHFLLFSVFLSILHLSPSFVPRCKGCKYLLFSTEQAMFYLLIILKNNWWYLPRYFRFGNYLFLFIVSVCGWCLFLFVNFWPEFSSVFVELFICYVLSASSKLFAFFERLEIKSMLTKSLKHKVGSKGCKDS